MVNFISCINADQVAWVKDSLWRYSETAKLAAGFPRVSKLKHGAESVCLLEILDILGLKLEDEAAHMNAFSGLLPKTANECVNTTKG